MSRRHATTLASRRRAAAETHSEISLLVCGLIVSIRRSPILLSAVLRTKRAARREGQLLDSPMAHALRRALRALLSMRWSWFDFINLILRRPRSGRLDRAG